MHKPNNILELDAKDALDWDFRIDDSRIAVEAKNGCVTMRGTVPTYYESTLAEDDVWTVGGVTEVDNQLLVGLLGAAMADDDIAAACKLALDSDNIVPKRAVSASVTDGWVTLTGEVRHHFQRQAAERSVRRVDGVLGITDEVGISSEPIPSDVVDRINKAFRRNAIIDDSLITVTNSGHTIYLDGATDSWAARQAADDAAWAAPGVDDVIDRLVIVP
jgi:osmotically-inducible protein OsmY